MADFENLVFLVHAFSIGFNLVRKSFWFGAFLGWILVRGGARHSDSSDLDVLAAWVFCIPWLHHQSVRASGLEHLQDSVFSADSELIAE